MGWEKGIVVFTCFYHTIAISHEQNHLVGGWYTYPNLKNDGVKVSWDDDIPNMDK